MIFFNDVHLVSEITRENPLYVGHFFELTGMWWSSRKARQRFIVSVAQAWQKSVKSSVAPGFIREEIFLTAYRKIPGARSIIEKFFKIEQLGYNIGTSKNSPTIVSPRRLGKKWHSAIDNIKVDNTFDPGPIPNADDFVVSAVSVLVNCDGAEILSAILASGREDLIPQVEWILTNSCKIPFYYKPAGILQARDTSVWPIRAIELWPGWLRTALFGVTIDIENSYCQFIVSSLEKKHAKNINLIHLKYADIFALVYDKQKFREQMCTDFLKLPVTSKSINVVKKIVMALANGSNISGLMAVNNVGRSDVADMINTSCPHLSNVELHTCGERLHRIARQLRAAKRELCFNLLGERPTHASQKKIFRMYFAWEREARYKIWNSVGATGLMMHDGLDGVITALDGPDLVKKVMRDTDIIVAVKATAYNKNVESVIAKGFDPAAFATI